MANRNHLPSYFLALILTPSLLTLAASPAHCDNTGYSYARIVRLSFVSGDVQVVRADSGNKWQEAVMNMPIQQGFAVGTNNGRAEIELESGSTIWLAENSVLQFTELALSNGGRVTRMTLSEGTATFETSLLNDDTFELATPSVKIVPSKKSKFRVDMFTQVGAVSVFNGTVTAVSAAGNTEVPKGETFALNGKATKTALKKNPATDEWDHWVSNRESVELAALNQSADYGNLPFTYGIADLANFGSWNFYPGFGYGWQPFGMTAGWAPFMAGQWMFYPSLGWTWLSSEPWGWVPFHFGGWQYSPTYGWMWTPGNYGTWTAAPVEWVGVGSHVGWIPRASNTAGSVGSPVIVSTKAIGKEGKNRVMTADELQGKLTPNVEPTRNGKLVAAGTLPATSAHIVVPTSANLSALREGLAVNAGATGAGKADIAGAHLSGTPSRDLTVANAAPTASRMPGRPPSRAGFSAGDEFPGYGSAGSTRAGNGVSTNASSTSSTSHASTSTSSGRPR